MLAIADRWTKQPQRLVGAADDWDLLWSASAAPVNQVNNQTAAPVAPNKPGVAGVWTDYQSTSAVQTFAVPATSTYTLFVVLCQPLANTGSNSRIFSNGSAGVRLEALTTYGGQYLYTTHTGVAAGVSWVTGVGTFDTQPWTYVITYDGTTQRGWLRDSSGLITEASPATIGISTASQVDFGSIGGPSCGLYAAGWRRGALSTTAARQLLLNPWEAFAKRPKRVFVTAGGGGGDVTVALSGQAATASAGTLVPSSSKALSGQAATISAGTLTPSISKALSGTAVTVSAGTLTPSRTVPLSGQAVTVSAGTITYNAGSDITLALSGAEVTASAGTLVPSSSVSLAGSAVTASAGTVVPTFPRTLSGSAVTVSAGTVTPSMSVPLVGQAVTVSAGTLTYAPEGDVTVALTGEAVTVSAGTLTASGGDSNQASGGFAGGWHAIVKGKRVFGSRDQLIRLMQAEAEEDAKEAAEEKPRAKAKPKPKKVIEEVTEVIEENTVGFIPAPPEVVRRDETAIRNMLSRIYADAYRAEFERQAAIKRRMEDDEDDEAILLFL